MQKLKEILELESESHQLWVDSFTNLAFCNLSPKDREKYIKQSYEATRLHSEAMDKLRSLIDSPPTLVNTMSITTPDPEQFIKSAEYLSDLNNQSFIRGSFKNGQQLR